MKDSKALSKQILEVLDELTFEFYGEYLFSKYDEDYENDGYDEPIYEGLVDGAYGEMLERIEKVISNFGG